jgi:hypothetical protein
MMSLTRIAALAIPPIDIKRRPKAVIGRQFFRDSR